METVLFLVGLIVGTAGGGLIGWLVTAHRMRLRVSAVETELALAQQREQDATRQAQENRTLVEQLRGDISGLQQERASLTAGLQNQQQRLLELQETHQQTKTQLESIRDQLTQLSHERATLLANLEAEKKSLQDQREQLNIISNRLKETFAELSVEALKKNTDQFMKLAEQKFKTLQTEAVGSFDQKKAEMAQLIQPMQQTLEAYKIKLDEIEKVRGQAYVDIKQHLTEVATTQKNLSVETRQLVQALRKPHGRGRWGELTLKRLFEMAGLTERVTFMEQVSTDDGAQRPDCIVHLPDQRQVIIDSKCVIDAFLDAHESTDDAVRRSHLLRHARQVRDRLNDLSKKAYWSQFKQAPDFVVLFLPGEAFLYAAVEVDPNLIEDALQQRVIIAAPSALLGLLRIIEHGWRQKQIEQSATAIRDLGNQLYERINRMVDHFGKLGKAIETVTERYNNTVGSLERFVLPAARKMSEMGIGDGQSKINELPEVEVSRRNLSTTAWKSLPESDSNFSSVAS